MPAARRRSNLPVAESWRECVMNAGKESIDSALSAVSVKLSSIAPLDRSVTAE